ncbi:sugar phosphate isomerase/epimerase [Evansella sp. AB-P1]|uniref:sugar phosphate isomerase/epimerase family protein n=1 Tax=Evansella sp. AB-P1 TaxID=3037653 RepID=UPI00241FCFE4|nr:sugar phosphate isomerase/epimerase family protein [Evansella sp. AB-P1]MDG5789041.1 sugar phosphate isomerase/epimerase [Evansella sp. AB-P1]
MKLAITVVNEASQQAPFVLRGDYIEMIKDAAKIGYDAVELHLSDPNDINIPEIKKVCKELDISISSIGTGLAYVREGLSLTSNDMSVQKEAVNRMKDFIQLGKELECVVIIGLIKGLIKDNESYESYVSSLNNNLRECLQIAEMSGVTLVIEAVNRYEGDFLNTISECVDYIEQFNSEYLKVHIDTFHMNIEEDDIGKSIIQAGNRIGHVHIADSNRQYPGQAHYNFEETINALKKIDYKGALSAECLSLPTPEIAARETYNYIRNFVYEEMV